MQPARGKVLRDKPATCELYTDKLDIGWGLFRVRELPSHTFSLVHLTRTFAKATQCTSAYVGYSIYTYTA